MDRLDIKLAWLGDSAAKRSITLDKHSLELPRPPEQRPFSIYEAQDGAHRCRVSVEGGLHRGDLPRHSCRESGAISSSHDQAKIRARDQTTDILRVDLTFVVLAVNIKDAGGTENEVIDVSLCARNFPVIKDNDVLAVDPAQSFGELGLPRRATLPGARRLGIVRRCENETGEPSPALANSRFAASVAPFELAHHGSTRNTEVNLDAGFGVGVDRRRIATSGSMRCRYLGFCSERTGGRERKLACSWEAFGAGHGWLTPGPPGHVTGDHRLATTIAGAIAGKAIQARARWHRCSIGTASR